MSLRQLTDDERRANAAKSLEVRRQIAGRKRLIRTYGINPLRDCWELPHMQGVKVYSLLICLPGVARATALSLLEQAGIPADNTVRRCGPRQTERLFSLLDQLQ